MKVIDIFNGDADGICALHQLRLGLPRPEAHLITGVKRDIALVEQVKEVLCSNITVLDISFDKNRSPVEQLLDNGNRITYIDHHFSGDLPDHLNLTAHIDTSAETCTSLIVDRILEGKYKEWAIAGAFGDNLDEAAKSRAGEVGIDSKQLQKLKEIGRLLNYNGYGSSLDDLLISPKKLYLKVHQYHNPFDFYQNSITLQSLKEGYAADMAMAEQLKAIDTTETGRVFKLPAKRWARRVVGVFSNQIAREERDKAHATLVQIDDEHYRVSIRAPLNDRTGADSFCRQFETGGGRAAAAGINSLPQQQLEKFLKLFQDHFQK